MKKLTLALTVAAASLLAASAARAQTIITSLPFTITAAGTYVLNGNLASSQTSGALIDIEASNVTIDFRGYYISGPVGNTSQTINALYANERSNLTIQNGTIANCYRGMVIDGNGSATTNNLNHKIDQLRVTRCLAQGVFIRNALGSSITNSTFSQIGTNNNGGTGIYASGGSVTVQNCVVSQIIGPFNVGITLGAGSFARQNTISGCTYGIAGGKYQDNLSANISGTAFMSGTDAGGNN